MNPLTAAVAGTAKSALITAEDFFPQSGGIHRLIQAKELRACRNGVRVGVCGVGDRQPRPGNLSGGFQGSPAAPTDDDLAIHRRRIGESSRRARVQHADEAGRNKDYGKRPHHRLRRFNVPLLKLASSKQMTAA